MTINFKEIPQTNTGDGDQDTFEIFARDFLEALGYEIEEGPGRGPDDGKDLVVLEPLSGILSKAQKRWLVSCKHFAHSGDSVGSNDESNIIDRVEQFNCDGFMVFYSTLPSASLIRRFTSLKDKISIEVLDGGKIRGLLRDDKKLKSIAHRYFPQSYKDNRKREAELKFEQTKTQLEHDLKIKREKAIRKRDALAMKWAE